MYPRIAIIGVLFTTLICHRAALADETRKLTYQETERTYYLHRPAQTETRPAPVVIGLHGLTESVADFRKWVKLDAVSDGEGFVAVYPEAIDLSWVYGRSIKYPPNFPKVHGVAVDDTGFIRAMIDKLVADRIADPECIYVTGVSRGALMAWTLACVLSDRIAAVAPISSAMTDHQREECHPTRRIPIFAVDGPEDPIQWYDGALAPNGRLLSVPETLEFWRAWDGCTGQNSHYLPHDNTNDLTRIKLVEWTGCSVPLALYRVEGGGHYPPTLSLDKGFGINRFGRASHVMEAARVLWDDFRPLTRDQPISHP